LGEKIPVFALMLLNIAVSESKGLTQVEAAKKAGDMSANLYSLE
jgi:hypothetical protein